MSIIIPAYNAAELLSTALDSVLAQTFDDFDVWIVDDGSSDNTADIVQNYTDNRINYVRQQNAGQSAAINAGVARCGGDWIKLLDADDAINPDHLDQLWQLAEHHPNSIISCRWAYFVEDISRAIARQEFADKDYDDPLEWIIDSLTHDEGMMGGWRWLIPKSVWKSAGGYDCRLSLNNDFHFSIVTLLASDGIRSANQAVYYYRKGVAGSLSGTSSRKAMESAFLTTDLGTQAMLAREHSDRVTQLAADRFQSWLFQLYPDHPDLAKQAEEKIRQLGGSQLKLQGGVVLQILLPLIGWKAVRKLQSIAYRSGWSKILRHKSKQRVMNLE